MPDAGPSDPDDPPSPCAADGPVQAAGRVLQAVQCDTARYVAMAPVATDVTRTYLVLTRTEDAGAPLSFRDVAEVPEIQNAVAHLSAGTESVRVLTHPGRRLALTRALDALGRPASRCYQYAGETFRLDVRVG